MDNLNIGALNSAMAGYNPPQNSQASTSSSPLAGILGTILQLGGMVGGDALGGPVGGAIGSGLGTGADQLLTGHGLNAGQIVQSGLSGLIPGMMGAKEAGAAADAADNAVKDTAAPAITGDLAGATGSTAPTSAEAGNGVPFNVDSTGNTIAAPESDGEPTSLNPTTGEGHVNLIQNPASGEVSTDTNNTFSPETPQAQPQAATQTAPAESITPKVATPLSPTTQTSPTDTFTQVTPPPNSQLNPGQKVANSIALDGLKQQVQEGGSRLTQAQAGQVAQNLLNDGYSSLGAASRDANFVTGDTGILSNGVNDHINNAEANGVSLNFGDYNDMAQKNINDAHTTGVLSPAQEKAAAATLNGVRGMIAGPSDSVTDTGGLTHVLPSNAIQATRELQSRAQTQFQIAQGRGPAADGATQLGNLYNKMGSDIMDRAFGTTSGNAPLSDANLDNMISQVKGANFENPTYQQNLVSALESGKGGNMSLQDLRHLQANHVGYSQAANPDEIGNLTNSLMSAGLSGSGVANAVLNSTPGAILKAKTGQTLSKLFTSGGSSPASADIADDAVTTKNTSGGRTMSPIGKGAAIAGVLAALGLGANAVATHNQSSNANAELNNPEYQKTQATLNQSDQLQRALGQMGEIRSVFAPTFDANAGQAGTTGQTLLGSANQNQAANTAATNLLTARGSMGQGGILGGILSMIPGTAENTYAKQAANAQAQLNALGIAGSAPTVAQGGGSIPALTSMAGNVGNF